MPVRKKTSTTRLPQSLRDEIDESVANRHPRKKRQPQISRKAARKQDRVTRKQNKAQFFSANATHNKRPAEADHEESPKRKKTKHGSSTQPSVQKESQRDALPTKPLLESVSNTSNKTRIPLEKSVKSKTTRLPSTRSRREEEEDAYITYLESKLGYTKFHKRAIEDDGLEDLLDLANSLAKPPDEDHETDETESFCVSDDGASSEEGSFEEWGGISDDIGNSEEEIANEGNEDIKGSGDRMDDKSQSMDAESPSESNTRYIPPHLRHAQHQSHETSENIIKLTRQVKGLLNRMSEQNIAGILGSIEEMYQNHKRNDVTSTLTNLIIDGISSHSSLLDSYVVIYAALVSGLHKIVGIEFAAHFVQNVVSLYEKYYAGLWNASIKEGAAILDDQIESDGMGKECSNLIVLLSELYNFQVVSSILIFDIIRGLLNDELTEFGIELLLKIVRNSGNQLRQDDPSALKDIIQMVQNKVSDKNDSLSSRTRFMIETLINLKNNKHKKNITLNQGAETVERMKKFLAGLAKKRHILTHEPLRISLEDLHSAETKGKWWLVGAAWNGDPLVDRQDAMTIAETAGTIEENSNSLLKLARSQGMNTDIRRSIFVVLMSSDDYVDACERLSQLNLTEVQQREIVRVILHCCGNEKSYNPYYTLVCQQLCRTSHSYKITLQFCLWDFFRDLGETSVGGTQLIKNIQADENEEFNVKKISNTRMENVAKAYAWWIAKDCVTLVILKPIDFTSLKNQSREFLREMLVQIFFCSQVDAPVLTPDPAHLPTTRNRTTIEAIFIKATRIQPLAMGLVYFMSETFRDSTEKDSALAKLVEWANEVGKDTLRTGVDVVHTL